MLKSILVCALITFAGIASAHGSHGESSPAAAVAKGYFEDGQVQPRALSDWAGAWQSVYPYLKDGTLAPVMEKKAQSGDKTAEQFQEYYDAGYRTDIVNLTISAAGEFVFVRANGTGFTANYLSDGHSILTYAKGNRGVRFIFKKESGDAEAPDFVQFSDHRIAPSRADHFHLYWGNDREALLKEVSHWPTFYPVQLSGADIVKKMLAH